MDTLRDFLGPNAGYVMDLFERYLRDPQSVDPETRAFFASWQPAQSTETPAAAPTVLPVTDADVVAGAVRFAHAVRIYGHLIASLDPLGQKPPGRPMLDLTHYGLTRESLASLPSSIFASPITNQAANALDAVNMLTQIYCTTRGYEYGHIRVEEERNWLYEAAETGAFRPPTEPVDEISLLRRLTTVEVFEQFLHRFFPGKTRFSIEGLDMLVPMLDEVICCAGDQGICTILIGMAHRGRLNVLAHILGKSYTNILAEFREPHRNLASLDQLGWTGDVKYHKGARRAVKEGEEIKLIISMAPNPSHLEFINPVVEGMARAADSKTDQPGPAVVFPLACLPILIHGDAAFPGEGIAAETLNLSRLPGYTTFGTVHIISNNQIGFTTPAGQGRSTYYASDLAKGFEVPVMHVNADDPEACLEAARTAFAYRNKFHKDFLIDLIGYRRYGHNEGDEPGFTQPLLYKKIEQHPSIRKLLADRLVSEGQVEPEMPDEWVHQQMETLQQALTQLDPDGEITPPQLAPSGANHAFTTDIKVPLERLEELNRSLLVFPEGFQINRKLERSIQRRLNAFDKPDEATIDWAAAEELAFATLLSEGTAIRLTGQDTERGTFSQRHAVFHDVETGATFTPLQAFPQAKASFDLHNSPLSENASVGFEFGYSILAPSRLNLWEAQYGDFIDSAQAMIDEFLVSAKAKWEQNPSLVLLLPHGYEGQGPDHSSARPERFLQLAAGHSLRAANATTAAQYFHLLRLQASLLDKDPLPLVIFTPKSLLRHPMVASTPNELANGRWMPVILDPWVQKPGRVRRLLLCTGKIAIDFMSSPEREKCPEIAITRVEQLLPFPEDDLRQAIEHYPNLDEVVWAQEEPRNMGAWSYIAPRLETLLGGRFPLRYLGRAASTSPAEGYTSWHEINQAALVHAAFELDHPNAHQGVIINKGETHAN